MAVLARRGTALLLAVSAVIFVSAAESKDFGPGDLRLCGATGCVPIENRDVLPLLGSFYYGETPPPVARSPRLGASMLELRFRNGYVTGIVATRTLDRFLSYGVHGGYFRRGIWYRLPAKVSQELRALSTSLVPKRVTRAALRKSA